MKSLYWFCCLVFLANCASTPEYSVRSRMAHQVRIIDNVPYPELYKAMIRVIQNEELKVKVGSSEKGVILATYAPTDKQTLLKNVMGTKYEQAKGEVLELVVNLDKMEEGRVRSRISLQQVQSFNLLGNHEGKEILSMSAYRSFYKRLEGLLAQRFPKFEMKSPVGGPKKKAPTSPVTGQPT